MVFNATFNNISVISWRSVLFGGGNRKTRRKPPTLSQVTYKLYHIMLYTSPWSRFELTTSVVIGTDCIGRCKSNYHRATAPRLFEKLSIWKRICVLGIDLIWPKLRFSGMCDLSRFWLFCVGHLVFLLPNVLQLFCFQIFHFWAYLMKGIPETDHAH